VGPLAATPLGPQARRVATLSAVAIALFFAAAHVLAVFRESVNWDEFAMLHRTATFVRTGVLQGGGRLAAAELVLAPLVRGCRNAVDTAVAARLLWLPFTFLGLAGLFALLRALRRDRPWPALGAGVGVALLALTPAFLRWSLQVRTDPAAIAFGMWGGVLLAGASRRPLRAAAAGALFGLGYLFTQKLLYVAGLCAIAVVGVGLIRAGRALKPYLDLFLAVATAIAAAIVLVVAYRQLASLVSPVPRGVTVAGGLGVFDYYRQTYGFAVYRGMLSTVIPLLLALLGLVVATLRPPATPDTRARLFVAWAVLGGGVAVGLFHAGAFPYFWLTLGLFPAVAIGLVVEEIADALPAGSRAAWLTLGVAWLVIQGGVYAAGLLRDTQSVQRASLEFVERNFPSDAKGFQAEGALACRTAPAPLPVMFRQNVVARFGGPRGAREATRFVRTFVEAPVWFLVVGGSVDAFPRSVVEFWESHYQPYFGPVHVAGSRLSGRRGERSKVSIVAPGRYRLLVPGVGNRPILRIGDAELSSGDVANLRGGPVTVEYLTDLGRGMLVLALPEPPQALAEPFYASSQGDEMRGRWQLW
jgi:hypothetical protein